MSDGFPATPVLDLLSGVVCVCPGTRTGEVGMEARLLLSVALLTLKVSFKVLVKPQEKGKQKKGLAPCLVRVYAHCIDVLFLRKISFPV